MKTTVEIADGLFDEARRVAAQRDTTLRALIEEGLRRVIAEQPKRFVLRDGSVSGKGLHADIRPGDWSQLRALIYGDVEDAE